jgi:hypothetical protein
MKNSSTVWALSMVMWFVDETIDNDVAGNGGGGETD